LVNKDTIGYLKKWQLKKQLDFEKNYKGTYSECPSCDGKKNQPRQKNIQKVFFAFQTGT
jgi:hypothetical protein